MEVRERPAGVQGRYTYMRDNWRVHTYLPYVGEHRLVKLRAVLSTARNRIEGTFATYAKLGLAGKAADRAWAADDEMEWLLSLAALSLTARALVHLRGAYPEVYGWAKRLGVLTPVELDDDEAEASPADRRAYMQWVEDTYGMAGPPP